MREDEDFPEEVKQTFHDLPDSIQRIFFYFISRYEPAAYNEPCVRKTTREIYMEIVDHCQQIFSAAIIFEFMTDRGFRYQENASSQIEWLLREKS